MSSYLLYFKADILVMSLDSREKIAASGGDATTECFDFEMLETLMADFRRSQTNGHFDTELNVAWEEFRARYRKDPGSSLDSSRRLRSLLIANFFPNRRFKIYEDSNTVLMDRKTYNEFEPEQLQILKYLSERPNEWVRIRDLIREIEILRDVDNRTVSRHIEGLCPELKDLIQRRPGKGLRFILPPIL